MWVVQEYRLAKEAFIFHDERCICERDFYLEYQSWKFGSGWYHHDREPKSAAEPFLPLMRCRKDNGKMLGLRTLLYWHADCGCLDPRDKVFALLDFLPTLTRARLKRFLPDYTLSYDDVVVLVLAQLHKYGWEYGELAHIQNYCLGHVERNGLSAQETLLCRMSTEHRTNLLCAAAEVAAKQEYFHRWQYDLVMDHSAEKLSTETVRELLNRPFSSHNIAAVKITQYSSNGA